MSGRAVWPPKPTGETRLLAFDFGSELTGGATISSHSENVTVHTGVDSAPTAILQGTSATEGSIISILVRNGVVGCVYDVSCAAALNDGSTVTMHGYLAVVPDCL